MTKLDRITTRYANNTYMARWRGKTASCTAGHVQAASAVAAKVLGNAAFKLKPCGGGQFLVCVNTERRGPSSRPAGADGPTGAKTCV